MSAAPLLSVIVAAVGLIGCGGSAPPTASAGVTGPAPNSSAGGGSSPHSPGHGHGHGHSHGDGQNTDAYAHSFADPEKYAQQFDSAERAEWQKPDEVVGAMQITPGMAIADLGAGTGYFLPHLSRAVGAEGQVVGLDIEPAMVDYMKGRIQQERLTNATAQLIGMDGAGIPQQAYDRILIVNTWHHIPNRIAYAGRLRTALRSGGTLHIVDFTRESPMGPPAEYRFTEQQVSDELTAAGFDVRVLAESLPYQFILHAKIRP